MTNNQIDRATMIKIEKAIKKENKKAAAERRKANAAKRQAADRTSAQMREDARVFRRVFGEIVWAAKACLREQEKEKERLARAAENAKRDEEKKAAVRKRAFARIKNDPTAKVTWLQRPDLREKLIAQFS